MKIVSKSVVLGWYLLATEFSSSMQNTQNKAILLLENLLRGKVQIPYRKTDLTNKHKLLLLFQESSCGI